MVADLSWAARTKVAEDIIRRCERREGALSRSVDSREVGPERGIEPLVGEQRTKVGENDDDGVDQAESVGPARRPRSSPSPSPSREEQARTHRADRHRRDRAPPIGHAGRSALRGAARRRLPGGGRSR